MTTKPEPIVTPRMQVFALAKLLTEAVERNDWAEARRLLQGVRDVDERTIDELVRMH